MKRIAIIAAAASLLMPLKALAGTDDTTSVSNLELKRQLTALQLSLDKIQKKMDIYDKPQEIIPTGEKNPSRFYCGLQFGLFLSHDDYMESKESKEQDLGTHFSYSIKPSFGYLFSDRLNAGVKIVFADCRFAGMSKSSFRYIIANAMMGGGIMTSDYMSWKIAPYVRYKLTKVIWDKVNLWAELSAYGGQKIPRDAATHKLQTENISAQYGISLRPMISCDLNKNLMIFTTMELLSWDGTCHMDSSGALTNNSVNFQFIPIYSIISGLFHIGILRKF